jgi:hypothetical protein
MDGYGKLLCILCKGNQLFLHAATCWPGRLGVDSSNVMRATESRQCRDCEFRTSHEDDTFFSVWRAGHQITGLSGRHYRIGAFPS